MNNAQFFDSASYERRFLEAHETWCKKMGWGPSFNNLAQFAGRRPSTALNYKIDEIVEFTIDNKTYYGRVVDYSTDGVSADLQTIVVATTDRSNTRLGVPENDADKYKAHIPEELMKLAKSELLKSIKCPLKED